MGKGTILILVLLVIFCTTLTAGTTGKLAGVIQDSTGHPIFNVAVIVDSLDMGAYTNEKGKYIIINIPSGVYSVTIHAMGYGKKVVKNVIIKVDKTTIINETLDKEEMQIMGFSTTENNAASSIEDVKALQSAC
ncbi:MAG: carboxypeptidase-like regulatory domain-containing protein, partial [Candidatus Cloacimonetes bacterium]|nr:carboxypeptidase-like regulatory domain-containing protein [Candidatus Cloacimonadota bacterium]